MGSLFKPSRKGFAALLGRELKARGLETTVHPAEYTLTVRLGERDLLLNLENLFDEYQRAPSGSRPDVVKRMLVMIERMARPVAVSRQQAQSILVPRLYGRAMVEEDRLRGVPMPHRLCTDQVAITLGLDFPESIQGVSQAQLDFWEMDFERAFRYAHDNLWRRSNRDLLALCPGVFQGNYEDGNDAARIVLQPLLLRLAVKGDPVAFVPDRGMLFVTGADDADGIGAALAHLGELKLKRQLSLSPLRLTGDQWVPLELPPGHPHGPSLARLRFEEKTFDHRQQKEFLESLESDVLVADCAPMVERETGAFFHLASWSLEDAWLLPECEHTLLFKRDDESAAPRQLTWEETRRQFPLKPTENWPPRWRYDPPG